MLFPKLTQLQSRLAAAFSASVILIILYFALTSPPVAYAAELAPRIPPDHNHPIIFDLLQAVEDTEEGIAPALEHGQPLLYEGLVTRAPPGVLALSNNDPQSMNIDAGQIQNWVFPKENIAGPPGVVGPGLPSDGSIGDGQIDNRIELRKRQNIKTVYVTANTCKQPSISISAAPSEVDGGSPPQLQLWVSQSTSLVVPGPSTQDNPGQKHIGFEGGYAILEINTNQDVYIGISAPNTSGWAGNWNYEIAVSIDTPFHSVDKNWANLFLVDGDSHAVLLVTNDTTQENATSEVHRQWMAIAPPYGVFAHNQNDSTILGVQNSFCGLKNQAQIMANIQDAENPNIAGMVSRGIGGKPKEQIYITDLNASSTYYGFLVMEGNSTASGNGVVGGGGKVWKAMNFSTKSEGNCALLYNLTFCSDVAYAVPSNPQLFDRSTGLPALAALYDSNAATLYQNFNYSLQQVPCKTSSVQRYSLARTCDDCARAYKTWLCAVTIPRCEDFSSPSPFLMPRNTAAKFANGSSLADIDANTSLYKAETIASWTSRVAFNSSRNPLIDSDIRPGPYKEVLPCEDLCYDLMQSCPASLGFACPLEGKGLNVNYGKKMNCNYLGAAYYMSAGGRVNVSGAKVGMLGMLLWSLLLLLLFG